MASSYAISAVQQSGGANSPGKITLTTADGDLTQVFQGRFYRDSAGAVLPAYTIPAPAGYTLIVATTFTVVDNGSYNGKYTVYTPASSGDANVSSVYAGGKTSINVVEFVAAPIVPSDASNVGRIIDVSTYLVLVAGEAATVIPPKTILTDRPVDLFGRDARPYGEAMAQNIINLTQNFAGPAEPIAPYLGQLWYDTSTSSLKLRTPGAWGDVGGGGAGGTPAPAYRYTQSVAATSWIINHSLNLEAPFVCIAQVFINTGAGGYKMVMPADITYNTANRLTITFTSPVTGLVLINP